MPIHSYREDMKHTPQAIIIGGGAGIESQIFEAYPEPATIGGGFQIAPNGMRVLDALGLADQVRAAGIAPGTSSFVITAAMS